MEPVGGRGGQPGAWLVDVDRGALVELVRTGVGGPLGVAAFGLVADGARVSAHGAASGDFAPVDRRRAHERGIVVRGVADVQFEAPEMVRLAGRALAGAAAGRIRPVMAREYPLAAAADAHRAMEARSIPGRALLLP